MKLPVTKDKYFYFLLFHRHVILGFTKDGRYLISYCLRIDSDDSSPLPHYVYSLHWWQFNQHRPLVQVCFYHSIHLGMLKVVFIHYLQLTKYFSLSNIVSDFHSRVPPTPQPKKKKKTKNQTNYSQTSIKQPSVKPSSSIKQ